MDPEIKAYYDASNATSTAKGMSHNLLKEGAKRRRTKQELNQARLAEQERLRDINAKVAQYDQMQLQIQQLQQQQEEYKRAESVVNELN